jgi:hypothetical protein
MEKHPILFSTEMVKAILEGRKTQTRRVIKNAVYAIKDGIDITSKDLDVSSWVKLFPYGQVGDRLWVRETWRLEMHSGFYDVGYKSGKFKQDADSNPLMSKYKHLTNKCWIWRPSIFMPRWGFVPKLANQTYFWNKCLFCSKSPLLHGGVYDTYM